MPPPETTIGALARRERVHQCGANDVYDAEVPFVMHGDVLTPWPTSRATRF